MRVRDVMTHEVKACRADDSLDHAADIMWKNDCGCVPVVDDELSVVGIITDRDICMAAYTQGMPLHQMLVRSAMHRQVQTCSFDQTTAAVEERMRIHQVRRVPVVDADGHLTGIVSMNDLARAAARQGRKANELSREGLTLTLAQIGETRSGSARAPAISLPQPPMLASGRSS